MLVYVYYDAYLFIVYRLKRVYFITYLNWFSVSAQQTFVSLQDMSWRRLQHVFNITILRLPRRLQDVLEDQKLLRWRRMENVLKTCLEDVLKTCLENFLKTCFEDVLKTVLKTSWRHYGGKQNTYWRYRYITNLNVYLYLTNLYLTNQHLAILRRIQNALSRTHYFNISLILEFKQHIYSRNKISGDVWCCQISWIKIRHCKNVEAIKMNF